MVADDPAVGGAGAWFWSQSCWLEEEEEEEKEPKGCPRPWLSLRERAGSSGVLALEGEEAVPGEGAKSG